MAQQGQHKLSFIEPYLCPTFMLKMQLLTDFIFYLLQFLDIYTRIFIINFRFDLYI